MSTEAPTSPPPATPGSPASHVPVVRGWQTSLRLLRDPTGFLQRCRQRHGDTFVCEALGRRVLFVFSPAGVRNLWALPEETASKGLADFRMLAHKVPDELFAGRRTRPHDLFARDDVAVYLENVRAAVDFELDALGQTGELELFEFTRRLSHRVGLASWGGLDVHDDARFDSMVGALDALDSSESFVHPHRALWTIATNKRRERRALHELDRVYAEILRERKKPEQPTLFDRICEAWEGVAEPERSVGIGRDVVLVHMGSQSNLFAAMAWTIVHLLERPDLLARVREGDRSLLDRCAHESIRLRQRSIVLREALRPLRLADERAEHPVAVGELVATMMSSTNTNSLQGLERFDPANYGSDQASPRFGRSRELEAPELVTTFGHGKHSCPAMRFSIESIATLTSELLARFDLEARFRDPQPLKHQIGGVARADRPCRVRYRALT